MGNVNKTFKDMPEVVDLIGSVLTHQEKALNYLEYARYFFFEKNHPISALIVIGWTITETNRYFYLLMQDKSYYISRDVGGVTWIGNEREDQLIEFLDAAEKALEEGRPWQANLALGCACKVLNMIISDQKYLASHAIESVMEQMRERGDDPEDLIYIPPGDRKP